MNTIDTSREKYKEHIHLLIINNDRSSRVEMRATQLHSRYAEMIILHRYPC